MIGISCSNPEIRYKLSNYIYTRKAKANQELRELDFKCWLSKSGHFVVDLGGEKCAAVNLLGWKNPLFAEILFEEVRVYSLWDTIKYMAAQFYDAPYEKLYSINIEKEKYKGAMTYQNWLNDLASSLSRYNKNLLLDSTIKRITEDKSKLAVINDVDVDNVRALQDKGGKVVRVLLEKRYGKSGFQGPKLDQFDAVIDARELKDFQIYDCLNDVLQSWGVWL